MLYVADSQAALHNEAGIAGKGGLDSRPQDIRTSNNIEQHRTNHDDNAAR